MSIHSDCGKEVRWVHRDDDPDRFHPPLEFAGQAYIITEDNTAVFTTTYRRHECDPDDIKQWIDLKRRQAEAKGIATEDIDRHEERIIARERDQKEANDFAMRVECPICKAPVAELCFNMALLKKGVKKYTKNPHPGRVEQAARETTNG